MIVIDASAMLAFLHGETGHEKVAPALTQGVMSVVNLAEVLQRFVRGGMPIEGVAARLSDVGLMIDRPDEDDATLVARLSAIKDFSMGDRFCIAAGARLSMPVLTADRAWAALDLPVRVELIR
jgi:PIN domain nuclease of toxin-antitoxin system